MAGDTILDTARYQAGDGDAIQAFPLGGKVGAATISDTVPAALDAAALLPECSLFMARVPDGRMLYVGRLSQLAGKTGDLARGAMFPLQSGTYTFVLTDEAQVDCTLLADAAGPFTLRILEAATVGGGA